MSQVDPIRAYFSLSEQEYLRVARQINAANRSKDLWQTGGGLRLTLADGTDYPAPGQFLAADRQIDPNTGTMRISAIFPNPQQLLRPGQYGRVTAETQIVEGRAARAAACGHRIAGHAQVRIVGPDEAVHVKTVKIGARIGTRWIVAEGLAAGDRVMVDSGAPARRHQGHDQAVRADTTGPGGH